MGDHDHDGGGYAAIVKEMEKDAARSTRERELERIFGESMPVLLRRTLDGTGGSKRPALRKLNDRLRNDDQYDHESNGLVSPNTFYSWLNTYSEALSDLV